MNAICKRTKKEPRIKKLKDLDIPSTEEIIKEINGNRDQKNKLEHNFDEIKKKLTDLIDKEINMISLLQQIINIKIK